MTDKFKLATDIPEWEWFDCSCCFLCPCGEEIQLNEPGDLEECECGRVYRLVCRVEVKLDND